MTAPSLESFFSGGGGKSVSWKEKPIGTTVTGTITSVGQPEQATDPATKLPAVTRQQKPRIQVRVTLKTAERDPQDPEDDGTRNLYVGGWMTGAIGDAMRKAGIDSGPPQVGAQLTVTLSERADNGVGVNPTNKFVASYVPPSTVATGQFFDAGAAAAGQAVGQQFAQQVAPQAPPAQQVQVPTMTPEQIAAFMATQQVQQTPPQQVQMAPVPVAPPVQQAPVQQPGVEPIRPNAIAPDAWNAMPLATKQAVAATFAGVPDAPPF